MKSIKFFLLAFAAITTSSIYAQTVDEVISKHVEAIGGKEKLSQVKSLYAENSVDVMGNSAPKKNISWKEKDIKVKQTLMEQALYNALLIKAAGW
jgi:hypothetical protein